jgi:5-methylcytosine-specific restriction protein A
MRVKAASLILSHVVDKIRALRQITVLPSLLEVEQKFADEVAASLKLPSSERLKRLADAPKLPAKVKVTTEIFRRNQHVVAQVLTRAAGHCESCKFPAPFAKASDGAPYLEVHHQEWLVHGGEDTVENAVALCPNCHRKAHYG